MGRILPSPIKNRVGYGFLKKKKKTRSGSGSGSGFIKKIRNPTRIRPDYHKITKKPPIYIAININPNSLIFQLTPPASSPSLPHFCSHLLSPHPRPSLPHTTHGLTPHAVTLRLTASHLTQSRSVSRSFHPPAWLSPPSRTHSHPPSRPHSHSPGTADRTRSFKAQ